LLARLSAQEFILLEHGALHSREDKPLPPWIDSTGVYTLARQDSHCCFAISGQHAATMFSKLCAIDLRPSSYNNGAIAQTSVARVSAIVMRCDSDLTPVFYLLASSTAAEYLWDALVDAMLEFDGRMVGLPALMSLQSR